MPAVMVNRLTASLFTDQTTVVRVQHPSEDVIAALLKASVGPPGPPFALPSPARAVTQITEKSLRCSEHCPTMEGRR